jgi:hypothetical protein
MRARRLAAGVQAALPLRSPWRLPLRALLLLWDVLRRMGR